MNSLRRLAAFSIAFAAATTSACAPLNRANAGLAAVRDTLARSRDTLAMSRAAFARRDSVYMPLDFTTPDSFLVAFETTKGRFDVMARKQWAPVGVTRFHELVYRRFYDSVIVFRVVKGFVAQFGLSGDPAVNAAWGNRPIADEPNRESNTRGRVSFARSGPGTRTTQLFINYGNNSRLDTLTRIDPVTVLGYPPIGEVVAGMEVVDSLYAEYGAAPQRGQDSLRVQGNAFMRREFPKLDMIRTARIIQEWRRPR